MKIEFQLNDPARLDYLQSCAEALSIIPLHGKIPVEQDWTKWCLEKRPFRVEEFTHCNAGITTGPASGLIVLDVDNPSLFESFRNRHGRPPLPPTYTVKSGKKGYHYYFAYPQDGKRHGKRMLKTLGVDILGIGGQAVAPFSIHPDTGSMYEVAGDCQEIAATPEWILDMMEDHRAEWQLKNIEKSGMPETTKQIVLHGAPKGQRSEAIMTVLDCLVSKGFSEDQIFHWFYTYPIGEKFMEKGQNRDDYLKTEIDKARTYTQPEPSPFQSLEYVTFADLLKMEPPRDRWLIKGFLEKGGSLLINGSTGLGKSVLTLNIALAAGCPPHNKLFGVFNIEQPCKTVFLQSENQGSILIERAHLMASANPAYQLDNGNVIFTRINNRFRCMGTYFRDENFKRLIGKMKDDLCPDILVVDPLISFAGADENNNNEMRKSLDALTTVCMENDLSVIVIHHIGKDNAQGVHSGRGASAIADWASNIVVLSKEKINDACFIKMTNEKNRSGKPFDNLHLKMNDALIMEAVDPYETFDYGVLKQIVIDNGGRIGTQKQFAEAVMKRMNIAERTAKKYIGMAVSKGFIKESRGNKGMHEYSVI